MLGKKILITGGTGSLGHALTDRLLPDNTIRIFSRDELKQKEMSIQYPDCKFLIGDVRDKERLDMSCEDIDYIIHCAALKHIDTAYYNPFEMIKTNIMGTQNVIDCALKNNVDTVVFISTDKAVEPINLYGATKLCGEKMFESARNYKGKRKTEFKYVRYGNVFGSRGSVIDVWGQQDRICVRGSNVTRFHLMLNEAVDLVLKALNPKTKNINIIPYDLPAYDLMDLGKAYCNVTGKEMSYAPTDSDEKEAEKLSVDCASDKAKRLTIYELESLIKNYIAKAI